MPSWYQSIPPGTWDGVAKASEVEGNPSPTPILIQNLQAGILYLCHSQSQLMDIHCWTAWMHNVNQQMAAGSQVELGIVHVLHDGEARRSLQTPIGDTYTLNRRWDRTESWGTPQRSGYSVVKMPFNTITYVLPQNDGCNPGLLDQCQLFSLTPGSRCYD